MFLCVCVKRFRPIIRGCNQQPRKVYNFTSSAQRISVLLRLWRDCIIRKLDGKKGINIHALCEDFVKFDVYINKNLSRDNSKVSTFLHSNVLIVFWSLPSYLDHYLTKTYFLASIVSYLLSILLWIKLHIPVVVMCKINSGTAGAVFTRKKGLNILK